MRLIGGESMAGGIKVVAENRKARHDYFVEETYETGIILTGTEIKSIKQPTIL
jgi:SsrA-binding protein